MSENLIFGFRLKKSKFQFLRVEDFFNLSHNKIWLKPILEDVTLLYNTSKDSLKSFNTKSKVKLGFLLKSL